MMDDAERGYGQAMFDRARARTLRGAVRQAYAAGREAGDAAMLAAGRTVWSEDDYNAACAAFERVLRCAADAARAAVSTTRASVAKQPPMPDTESVRDRKQ